MSLGCSAWAQPGAKHISISPLSPLVVKRGSTATQSAQVVIDTGFHVNSDKPANEFLIPFRLDWETGPITASAISYPHGEELQVGPDKLSVYTGTVVVKTTFRAAEFAPAGKVQLKGKLHFQACNTQMCFRPASVEVLLPVTVE